MYPEIMVIPMREELTRAGVSEARTAAEVDAAIAQPAQGQGDGAYLAASNYLQSLGISGQGERERAPACVPPRPRLPHHHAPAAPPARPAAELNRVLDLAMNPNSLYGTRGARVLNPHARKLDVETDIKPVAAFLQAQGLAPAAVARLVSAHPPVLCYSVEGRLQPLWAYLSEELGLGQERVAAVLEARPSLLGVDAANLRRVVGYLLASGSSLEEVETLLSTTL